MRSQNQMEWSTVQQVTYVSLEQTHGQVTHVNDNEDDAMSNVWSRENENVMQQVLDCVPK